MKHYLELIDTDTPGARNDVTPVFADPEAFGELIDDLLGPFPPETFDLVAGIDALGFVLGAAAATRARKGFVPIRKAGTLPVPHDEVRFTDYSGREKGLTLSVTAIKGGRRVLVVDDWIETGAQVRAAVQLVERQGGVVAGIVAIQIDDNPVTRRLLESYRCRSVAAFE